MFKYLIVGPFLGGIPTTIISPLRLRLEVGHPRPSVHTKLLVIRCNFVAELGRIGLCRGKPWPSWPHMQSHVNIQGSMHGRCIQQNHINVVNINTAARGHILSATFGPTQLSVSGWVPLELLTIFWSNTVLDGKLGDIRPQGSSKTVRNRDVEVSFPTVRMPEQNNWTKGRWAK